MPGAQKNLKFKHFMFKASKLFAAGIFLLAAVDARAQMFSNPELESAMPAAPSPAVKRQSSAARVPAATNRAPGKNVPFQNKNQPERSPQHNPQPVQAVDDGRDAPPEEPKPVAVELRFVGGEVLVETRPKIYLYSRDFKISRNMNGSVNCTMRFYVLSTAKEKITNLSYRLKWPGMETALSFDDVSPNKATFYDYSLLGNGCYTMDKAPNVIVNRCRIKGMSQRQCADAIQWIE